MVKAKVINFGNFRIYEMTAGDSERVIFESYCTTIGVLSIDKEETTATLHLTNRYSVTTECHKSLMIGYLINRFNPIVKGLKIETLVKMHTPTKKNWYSALSTIEDKIKIIIL